MILICGLLGRNIQYSKSPEIHNDYYREHNIELQYRLFDIEENELSKFIASLSENNIIGFNVTIPYKQAILKYLSGVIEPADSIGAVNTVLRKEDKLIGFNTDYLGFIGGLKEKNVDVNGKSALIIGAGGAAKCAFWALKSMGAERIEILSRKPEQAKQKFPYSDRTFNFEDYIDLKQYNIIVNCTPLGGPNNLERLPVALDGLKKDTVVYDLNYIPKKTRFLEEAEKLGAVIINGETMLKQQAYEAIEIWKANIERGDNKVEITK